MPDVTDKPILSMPPRPLGKRERQALVFRGTRLRPAPAALRQDASGGLSFMVSSRSVSNQTPDNPDGDSPNDTVPLSGGDLYWYTSTTQDNDPHAGNYLQGVALSATVPTDFENAIVGVLNAQAKPQLTVFIHGLGNLFSDAVAGTSALGANLHASGSYPGLVIGYDWPSYDEFWSGVDYATTPYAFPPGNTSGTIRDNINGSQASFANFLTFLSGLATKVRGLSTSVVCHSEGNYVLMAGLDGASTVLFDHVLLLAADINNGALLSPAIASAYVGQGQGIYASATDVSVYFTDNDDVLYGSYELLSDYHDPTYYDRLGYSGLSGAQAAQSGNVYSVNCASVLDDSNVEYWAKKGNVPSQDTVAGELHSAYLYIPQILYDMAQVLTGAAQAGIANRQSAGSSQWFTMDLNNATGS